MSVSAEMTSAPYAPCQGLTLEAAETAPPPPPTDMLEASWSWHSPEPEIHSLPPVTGAICVSALSTAVYWSRCNGGAGGATVCAAAGAAIGGGAEGWGHLEGSGETSLHVFGCEIIHSHLNPPQPERYNQAYCSTPLEKSCRST